MKDDDTQKQLPLYECHKTVRAAKITEIKKFKDHGNTFYTLVFGEIVGRSNFVSEWVKKFNPEVGGYYVLYDDGYSSYSPAGPFEKGYNKV